MDMNQSLDDAVPRESKYLKKEDVGEQGVNLTIAGFDRVNVAQANEPEDSKVIVRWQEDYKPMVLNVTNSSRLKAIHKDCDKLSEFVGKQVCAFNDPFIEFGGQVVGGIRLRPVADEKPEPHPDVMPAGQRGKKDPDDDIPF